VLRDRWGTLPPDGQAALDRLLQEVAVATGALNRYERWKREAGER